MSYAIKSQVGAKGSKSMKPHGSRLAFGQSGSSYRDSDEIEARVGSGFFFVGAGPDEALYYVGESNEVKESFESSYAKLPEKFRKIFAFLDWKQLSPALASVFFGGIVKDAYGVLPEGFRKTISLEEYGLLCERAITIDKIIPIQVVSSSIGGWGSIFKAVKKVGASVAKNVKAVTKKLSIKNIMKVAPFVLAVVPGVGILAAGAIEAASSLIRQKQEQAQALRDAASQATADNKAQAEYDAQAAAQAAADGAAAQQAAAASGLSDAQQAAKAEAAYKASLEKFKTTVPPPPPSQTLLPAQPPAGFKDESAKSGFPIYQEGMPIPKGTIFVVGYDVGAEEMRIVGPGSGVVKGELVKAAFPIVIKDGIVKLASNTFINRIWTSNTKLGKASIVSGGVLLLGLGGFLVYKMATRNKVN